jgi:hypothetical protein
MAHARALLTSDPQGAAEYLDADARDTGKILTAAAELLDFSQPVAVMLIAILQLVTDDDDPYDLVARLMAEVPSGSFLVVTHVTGDMRRQTPGAVEAARRPRGPACGAASPGSSDAPRRCSAHARVVIDWRSPPGTGHDHSCERTRGR